MIFLRCRNSVENVSGLLNLNWLEYFSSRRFIKNNTTNNDSSNFESLIIKNTVISRNHLTPELKLRLITPECKLWQGKASESEFPDDPFWGIYWPGGQALARYILDNKKLFQDKNVLDIGSGSGACALAAVKSGAKFVLANDIDPVSIKAIQLNSQLNNLSVETHDDNIIGKDIDFINFKTNGPKLKWDVILIGDLFYDNEFSNKLFIWLSSLAEKNKLVLVGDPGRYVLKEINSKKKYGSLVKLVEYSLCDKEHNGFSTSCVFKIEPSKNLTNIHNNESTL